MSLSSRDDLSILSNSFIQLSSGHAGLREVGTWEKEKGACSPGTGSMDRPRGEWGREREKGPPCNACSSQARDGRGGLAPLTSEPCGQPCGVAARPCTACSPYSSPFYIRTADMVPNGGGGERLSFAPSHYKEGGPLSLQLAAPQGYPVTWPGSGREAFTNPRAISTDV
ncbi:protein FAM163A [Pteropus vampyrus]|uniref:Protein FAM163A n=1 Tax=Pteropus vampyrus TaxID=132908 RepID=A0A6P6CI74_PTEVA|nr:protein FAM163A [Pteropus vampyrus]